MPREKRDPRYEYTYKTAVFEIHNPSQKKQRVLRDALRRNHLAYSKLLPLALSKLEEMSQMKGETQYSTNKDRIKFVRTLIAEKVKSLPLGGASKAGLQDDIADAIASHLALLDDYEKGCAEQAEKPEGERNELSRPGLPTAARLTPFQQAHEEAYESLAISLTLEEEEKARDGIAREDKSGLTRPILFMKNRMSDGFVIYYDEPKDRYLMYLNLYGVKSRHATPIKLGGLVDIRTGEVMPDKRTNKTGLLFQVNFSEAFQREKFLMHDKSGATERQKIGPYFWRRMRCEHYWVRSASAKLLERNKRFEVHIAFEYMTRKITPETYLGVDRGIYNLASLCVVDDVGRIIAEENVDGRDLRDVQQKEERRQRRQQKRGKPYKSKTRLAEADKAVHRAANKIVKMAVKHKSQVVLENLSNLTQRKGKRGRSNFNRILTRAQYTKLAAVLKYKLAVAGLPKLKTVAAQGTSQTCPDCGRWNHENRKKPPLPNGKGFATEQFLCVTCGYEHDADLNAARIIALKMKWRDGLPKSQKIKTVKVLAATKYGFECCLTSWTDQRK